MYPLFESIKIKNGFAFHLSLHQQRMNKACMAEFGAECSLKLYECLEKIIVPDTGLYKWRLNYDDGEFKSETQLYTPKKIASLKLIFDDEIEYAHKFSDRSHLDALVELKGSADEIIIVKNGFISDASYANLIFWDGRDWFTPNTPLLKGVQREKLLKDGIIQEKEIRPSDLPSYQKVALINAMLDFDDKIEVPIENVINKG